MTRGAQSLSCHTEVKEPSRQAMPLDANATTLLTHFKIARVNARSTTLEAMKDFLCAPSCVHCRFSSRI